MKKDVQTVYERHKKVMTLSPEQFRAYDRFARIGLSFAWAFCFGDQAANGKEMETVATMLLDEVKREMNPEKWRDFMAEFEKGARL